MHCGTDSLDQQIARAEARKGYQIRLANKLGIGKKARQILIWSDSNSTATLDGVTVYRLVNSGVEIRWFGEVVYRDIYNSIKVCHLDAWTDVLDQLFQNGKVHASACRIEQAKKNTKLNILNRSFG